jgi:hypothetical protein
LLPNFTALAHSWVSRADAPDVVLFDYEYRDNDTRELILRSDFNDKELRRDPLRYAIQNQINPFCGLYRRTRLLKVGGYDTDPSVLYNEDVAFHCKLAVAGFTFRAEKQLSIINYRIAGSMSDSNKIKCLHAHYAVMKKVFEKVGCRYSRELVSRFWVVATGLAAAGDWVGVSRALDFAASIDRSVPRDQPRDFAVLCRILGPRIAFRIREALIQRFKPALRRNYVRG